MRQLSIHLASANRGVLCLLSFFCHPSLFYTDLPVFVLVRRSSRALFAQTSFRVYTNTAQRTHQSLPVLLSDADYAESPQFVRLLDELGANALTADGGTRAVEREAAQSRALLAHEKQRYLQLQVLSDALWRLALPGDARTAALTSSVHSPSLPTHLADALRRILAAEETAVVLAQRNTNTTAPTSTTTHNNNIIASTTDTSATHDSAVNVNGALESLLTQLDRTLLSPQPADTPLTEWVQTLAQLQQHVWGALEALLRAKWVRLVSFTNPMTTLAADSENNNNHAALQAQMFEPRFVTAFVDSLERQQQALEHDRRALRADVEQVDRAQFEYLKVGSDFFFWERERKICCSCLLLLLLFALSIQLFSLSCRRLSGRCNSSSACKNTSSLTRKEMRLSSRSGW